MHLWWQWQWQRHTNCSVHCRVCKWGFAKVVTDLLYVLRKLREKLFHSRCICTFFLRITALIKYYFVVHSFALVPPPSSPSSPLRLLLLLLPVIIIVITIVVVVKLCVSSSSICPAPNSMQMHMARKRRSLSRIAYLGAMPTCDWLFANQGIHTKQLGSERISWV